MELNNGDVYEQINSRLRFTLRQETPVTWSLNLNAITGIIDYPIYPEKHMKDLLDKNFRRIEDE